VDSVTREKDLQPSELTLVQPTAESLASLRVATPDEQVSRRWITLDYLLAIRRTFPSQRCLLVPDKHIEIALTFRAKAGVEILMGRRIVTPTGNKKYLSEHLNRVLRQFTLSDERARHLILTDNIPSMQRVLIAKVRNELRHRHVSAGPWDDTLRIHFEYRVHELSHSPLFAL
jgi:hypothetical protein